jgi:prepilin-type processing-associated H-X9-DG protein
MQRVLPTRGIFIVGVVVALGGWTVRGEDLARVMPKDTALYVGWSGWVAPDAPTLPMQRKLIAGVLQATQPGAEAEQVAWVAPLLDAVEPLQTGSVGIGLFNVTLDAGTPQIDAALIVAGPEAQRLPDAVHNFFVRAVGADQIERHAVQDAALECVRIPDSPMTLIWGLHKNYFILALGDTATLKVIDCIENRAPNLAAADEFTRDRKKLGAQTDGRYFCAYADVQRIVTRGKEIARQALGELPENIDQILEQLGIASIRSKYVHIDELDGRPRMAAFADVQGPLHGVLKLWDQKPLIDDDIRIVPKNAYWAEITNVDLAALWLEVQRVIDVLAPDKAGLIEGPLAMAQQVLGFSITNELLPALGDTWAVFDAPDHGGILLTGTVLAVEVRDAEALQGMLARVVQLLTPLAKEGEITLQLNQVKHGSHTIHYVLLGGRPVPLAPAWGFAGQRCVFGLFPQTVATALQQVDPQTQGESLLDQPDFKAVRAKLPPNVQGIGYCDSRYFMRALYYPLLSLLQTAGISMLAPYGGAIDLALMPPLLEATADVTNYVSATGSDPDGILYTSIGSGASLPVGGGVTALGTSILLPSLARAREVAKRAISASNLKGIGMAALVFAADHGDKFPGTLAQLVESGAITPMMLLSPRDAQATLTRAYSSYEYIAGQTTSSDARNVLAYERPLDDEGTNVLFVDTHVEWMKPDAFKAAVRETYQRLGRESELPPELRK